MVYFDVIWKYRQGGRGCLYTVPRGSECRFKGGRFRCERDLKDEKNGDMQGQKAGKYKDDKAGKYKDDKAGKYKGNKTGKYKDNKVRT